MAESVDAPPGAERRRRGVTSIARVMLAAILALAILDLLVGVLLRYVVVRITDTFDLPTVSFFWVEEVGEFALAWLTLIGAAIAILERTHFGLSMLVHRFPPRWQRGIERANHLLIAAFGALAAGYGWKIAQLNSTLTSPGLQINLAWLYFSAVIGGALIAILGLGVALGWLGLRDIDGPEGTA